MALSAERAHYLYKTSLRVTRAHVQNLLADLRELATIDLAQAQRIRVEAIDDLSALTLEDHKQEED